MLLFKVSVYLLISSFVFCNNIVLKLNTSKNYMHHGGDKDGLLTFYSTTNTSLVTFEDMRIQRSERLDLFFISR